MRSESIPDIASSAYLVSSISCLWIAPIPILVKYFSATPKPTICAMFGTPGSNLRGADAQVASVIVTDSIIDPPNRNGGSSSSKFALPQRTPTPVGPTALCPEKARKSISRSATFTGICGTDWQASRMKTAPTAWVRFTKSSNGTIVPRTFDW